MDLLLCPFCESEPETKSFEIKNGIPKWFIECSGCHCKTDFYNTKIEAEESWNYRTKGDCIGYHGRKMYSVWNNKTDQLVCANSPVEECCKAMGIKTRYFHVIKSRAKHGRYKKWHIEVCG